jgi:hypothetical protein
MPLLPGSNKNEERNFLDLISFFVQKEFDLS